MLCRRKTFALFLLFFLVSFQTQRLNAQVELMGAIGSSHFLGDLGGKPLRGTNDISDLDLASTRYALVGGVRLFLGGKVALRANMAYARVAGDDSYTINTERRGRNANFYSPIIEGSGVIEFHLNRKKSKQGASGGLYLYGGVGMFYFEPYTKFEGDKVKLRPLGTEGQYYRDDLEPYKNTSVNIPFGMGYRFKVGRGYLGLEINSRKNFTDYIDDVSTVFADPNLLFQSNGALAVNIANRSISNIPGFDAPGAIRGNPNNMDHFFFILLKYDHPLTSAADMGFGAVKRGRGKGFNSKKGKCWEF